MNSYRIVANSMQAFIFIPEIATIIQMVKKLVFLNIYNCVWKLAFLKFNHTYIWGKLATFLQHKES